MNTLNQPKPPETVTPDRPYYVAPDFSDPSEFGLYVAGARCCGGRSRDEADKLANDASDKHETIAKRKRLEAAAPELLAALSDLLRLAERCGLCPVGESRCEMDAAREAIAKATQ